MQIEWVELAWPHLGNLIKCAIQFIMVGWNNCYETVNGQIDVKNR